MPNYGKMDRKDMIRRQRNDTQGGSKPRDKRQMKDERNDRMRDMQRMMPDMSMPSQQMPMGMTVDQIQQMMMEQDMPPMPQAQNLPGGIPMPSMVDPRLMALRRMLQS